MAPSPGKTLGAVGDSPAYGNIQKIGAADLVDALAKGIDDFKAQPSHLVILAILYPVAMVVSANVAAGYIPLSVKKAGYSITAARQGARSNCYWYCCGGWGTDTYGNRFCLTYCCSGY